MIYEKKIIKTDGVFLDQSALHNPNWTN